MGDENPIRTLGDYSKPSHEGYKNTIELPVGNNMVPLRSDTIRLVQNGCSFYGLRSEDPNQHLKDFLKLMDSLDIDGSITTWEDLTTQSLSEAWTRFKDLLQKVPHHGIDLWLQLRDRNAKESWALLEDLALYDNKSWNNPRDFTKLVKAISLPQNVPYTSDRRLIELKNQVQRWMEAHLAPTQPTQVNKITTSFEIYSGPHDTQYCVEDPDQAFVKNASSRTDEVREGLVSNFMASQDVRLSKFEADFKQQQSEMTNKINTVLKAITDRIAGALPRDTVKNPKGGCGAEGEEVPDGRSLGAFGVEVARQSGLAGFKNAGEALNNTEDTSPSLVCSAKENEEEEKDSPKNIHANPSTPPDPLVLFIIEKVLKLNSFFESLGLVPQSSDTKVVCTKGDDGEVMFIEIIRKNNDSREEGPEEEGSTKTEGGKSRIF
ncbi:hypothetical protein Tco_0936018 [Tanacetum coccineum]